MSTTRPTTELMNTEEENLKKKVENVQLSSSEVNVDDNLGKEIR